MKIIIATDKFKGSLSSFEVGEAIKKGIQQIDKNAEILLIPMADGGDGFGAVIKHYLHTKTIRVNTVDPLMRKCIAGFEWDIQNKTAYIELAAASGLTLLKPAEQNPLHTSTYGTGILIKEAWSIGAKKIVLGLGGSATNDAGLGILSAMGFIFKDENNNAINPIGKNLLLIKTITAPDLAHPFEIILATDVVNVLYGPQGAANQYAAQKGAGKNEVELLDKGLRHIAALIQLHTGKDISMMTGGGAAGGVAAGLAAYLPSQILSGAKMIATISEIEQEMPNANLVITGEGQLDAQSSKGKVVLQIASLANQYKVPVIALCGQVKASKKALHAMGIHQVYSLVNDHTSPIETMKNAAHYLQHAAATMLSQFNNPKTNQG